MGKNILVIGVGGTGSTAVDLMFQKQEELGNQAGNTVNAIVLDTDKAGNDGIAKATVLSMTDDCTLGDVVNRFDPKALEDWIPCYPDDVANKLGKEPVTNYAHLDMNTGANQWRKKSYLAFINMMKNEGYKFDAALNNIVALHRTSVDPGSVEVYIVASLAGGTGSGSFLPIAFYVKKFFESAGITPKMRCILACPDIYEAATRNSPMQNVKVYANAYAILRELNAITEVAFGHNKPSTNETEKGKNLIRFKLGHASLPIGVLFDAEDEHYWNPGAVPFGRIYLLDKIPGIDSIPAHNGIMANTLYNLVCTEVGLAFDSVENNDDPDLVNEGNHSANFSAAASSELRYPFEDVMAYIAYKKTEEAAKGEWMTIYKDVEERLDVIRERREERGLPFTCSTSEYAAEVMKSVESLLKISDASRESKPDPIVPLLERGYYQVVESPDGTKERKTRTEKYLRDLESTLKNDVDNPAILSRISARGKGGSPTVIENPGILKGKSAKNEAKASFAGLVASAETDFNNYYREAVKVIRTNATTVVKSILPVDGKDYNSNADLSLVYNLLMRDGSFVHPVSAFVQLCDLRLKIDERLSNMETWSDITSDGLIPGMPSRYYECSGNTSNFSYTVSRNNGEGEIKKVTYQARSDESAYAKLGKNRFAAFASGKNASGGDGEAVSGAKRKYMDARTDLVSDSLFLAADIDSINKDLSEDATKQYLAYVLSFISPRVDTMIEQYRKFFEDFEEKRIEHTNNVASELKKNEPSNDNQYVTYIAADGEAKEAAYRQYISMERGVNLKQIDNAAGKSVVDIAHRACVVEYQKSRKQVVQDVVMDSSSVFEAMIEGYVLAGKETDYYKEQSAKGIIEVLIDDIKRKNPDAKSNQVMSAVAGVFTSLHHKATPAINLRNGGGIPYSFMLMPQTAAKYLRRVADEYGFVTAGFSSASSRAKMSEIEQEKLDRRELGNLADQFVSKCQVNGLSVRLAQNIPNHVVYLTRKVNQIKPIMLEKVNETERAPLYFNKYNSAISEMYTNNADTWNPHLGMEIHKHGYLPYINADYEKAYNLKVAKALLYMLLKGKLSYRTIARDDSRLAFFYTNKNGIALPIRQENVYVTEDYLHLLMSWLRMNDNLVVEYSGEYDKMVKDEMAKLPNVSSPSQIGTLMGRITKSELITKLRTNVFAAVSGTKDRKKLNVGLVAFAYNLKATEEAHHDAGDAERILAVGYETVKEFCEHGIPTGNRTGICSSHIWQLKKFVWAFATSMAGVEENRVNEMTSSVFTWANENNCFRKIRFDSNPTPDETWDEAPVDTYLKQMREGGEPESVEDDVAE